MRDSINAYWYGAIALFLTSCVTIDVKPGAEVWFVHKYATREESAKACEKFGLKDKAGCTQIIADDHKIIHTFASEDCLLHEIKHAEEGDWHPGKGVSC